MCEVCRQQGVYTYSGLEVHHIVPVREDTDRLLDDDNLICLCTAHHKAADRGEISREALIDIVKRRGV